MFRTLSSNLALLCCALTLAGCTSSDSARDAANTPIPIPEPEAVPAKEPVAINAIGGTENPDRLCDVVFIHGLGGEYIGTWESDTNPKFLWPKALSEDFKDYGVWSVKYDASPTEWVGGFMPIEDRGRNLLEEMRLCGIGKRPIAFVCHSLGGLVTKRMLQSAWTLNNPLWQGFEHNTKGVVFLATPHQGSSYATYMNFLGEYFSLVKAFNGSILIQQLEKNNPALRDLNLVYRQNADGHGVKTAVFFETKPVPKIGMIVPQDTADPGVTNVIAIAIDADHITICKPENRDSLVYRHLADFIPTALPPPPKLIPFSMPDYMKQFREHIRDHSAFPDFKRGSEGGRIEWDVMVKDRYPDTDKPFWDIRESKDATDRVLAYFSPNNFTMPALGSTVRIGGIISDQTSELGIILRDCSVLPDRATEHPE